MWVWDTTGMKLISLGVVIDGLSDYYSQMQPFKNSAELMVKLANFSIIKVDVKQFIIGHNDEI